MEKSLDTYCVRNKGPESDSDVCESSVSSYGDEVKSIKFEECSFNEDSFNDSVKNKYHSTMMFANVDTIVPPSDDEDVEDNSGDKCSLHRKIKSDKSDRNSHDILNKYFSKRDNVNSGFSSTNQDFAELKEIKSFIKSVENSSIIVDSSPESSPVFIKRFVNYRNRIIDSGSEDDDLVVENRKVTSDCDSSIRNDSIKSGSGDLYSQNESEQNIMGFDKDRNMCKSVRSSSNLVGESSLENSHVFVRRDDSQHNRFIDSNDKGDRLIEENVSGESGFVCDSDAQNVSNKSINKSIDKHTENSYYQNETKQDVMGCEENKSYNISNKKSVLGKPFLAKGELEQSTTVRLDTRTTPLSKNGTVSESRKYCIQPSASCSTQHDNVSVASVIESNNNAQNKPTAVITMNSDSVVQYYSDKTHQTVKETSLEDCLQNLNISTTHKIDDIASDIYTKQILENDLASRAQSLLAEDKRLRLQIMAALRDVENSETILKTVNTGALPDKGLRLHKNLCRHKDHLHELRHQQSILTSELSKLPDSATKISQHIATVQQASVNSKKENHSVYPVWSKLPTSTTNVADLGKRALETHRTQQALTMDALKTLHKSLETCPPADSVSEDPEALLVQLMPHQKHALSWLLWREKQKPSGGILADDMGLGKTLTMIALVLKSVEEKSKVPENSEDTDDDVEAEELTKNWIASSKEKKVRKGKTLVVCPATLLGQWENEINKRVQEGVLDVELHHGTKRENKARRLARKDVVISTYSIIMRDFGEFDSRKDEKPREMGPLFRIRWERVILDEAHQVRNYKSKTAVAVCNLKAKYRWAVTGTPVHNKEMDLFALLKFLRCSPFDDINVWRKWVDNRDAAGSQRLNTLIKSLMLRRTKKDLQGKGSLQTLKDKSELLIYVKLDDDELKVYKKMLDFSKTLLGQYLYQKAEKEDMLLNMPVSSNGNRYLHTAENPFKNHPELAHLHQCMANMPDVKSHEVLVVLLRLRQICCHPSLIKTMLDKETYQQDGIEDVDGLDLDLMDRMKALALDKGEPENNNDTRKMTFLSSDNPVFAEDRISSKVQCMLRTLQEKVLCTGDKAIIVSQWTSMLNVICSILKEQKINCCLLTGSVPVKQRMTIVDDFNRDHHGPKVMLLSLTAGGVGLNLVGANHLMLLDLHWNPQLETQACDRVYRVGQKKSVKIYKFVCSDTIEENILKLQEKKLAVADNVLTGVKFSQMSKLTLDDLKMLFSIA